MGMVSVFRSLILFSGAALLVHEGFAQGLPGWSRSKEVKLNTSATGANIATAQKNYPVPVLLNKDNFVFTEAKDDGSDIRFTTATGAILPHEIEYWDKAGETAALWVKSDVAANSANQGFHMHWGNAGAPNTSSSKAVFDTANGWVATWHLGDDADSTKDGFKDATGVNHGTGHHMEKGNAKPGRMGMGCDLNHLKKQGVKVVENRKNFNLDKNVTFSIWCFIRSFGYDKGYESMMTKGDESWRYMRANKTNGTEICSDGNGPKCTWSKSMITFGKWYHFAGVHDNPAVRLFFNGKREDDDNADSDHYSGGDHPATLGFSLHKNVEQRFMDMIIDEARITKDSKTDDWLKLDYESLKEGSAFATFGPATGAFVRRTIPGYLAPAPERGKIELYDLQGRLLEISRSRAKGISAGIYVPAAR